MSDFLCTRPTRMTALGSSGVAVESRSSRARKKKVENAHSPLMSSLEASHTHKHAHTRVGMAVSNNNALACMYAKLLVADPNLINLASPHPPQCLPLNCRLFVLFSTPSGCCTVKTHDWQGTGVIHFQTLPRLIMWSRVWPCILAA